MQQQLDGVRPAECVGWPKRLDNDVERFSGRCRFRDVIANLLQDFASIRWIKPADGRLEMRHVALDNGMSLLHATSPLTTAPSTARTISLQSFSIAPSRRRPSGVKR